MHQPQEQAALAALYHSADNSESVAGIIHGNGMLSKNNSFTEMRSGSEEGSYSRLTDGCVTQL
jgi:hypothetical protein